MPWLPYMAAQTIMGLFLASGSHAGHPAFLPSGLAGVPCGRFPDPRRRECARLDHGAQRRHARVHEHLGLLARRRHGDDYHGGEFGADARLVAFMQYFRVACVAGLASVVAAVFAGGAGAGVPEPAWFPPLHFQGFAATVLIAAGSAALASVLRLPSGPMLIALGAGAAVNLSGAVEFELPRWLLTGTYALVGWSVGLRFTPEILAHAFRAFPTVLLNVALLIAFSAGVGAALSWMLGIDALTAYLATSPGAMESVAIIAASSHVDVPFIITLQMVRFLTIIAAGPPIARFLARHAGARRAP